MPENSLPSNQTVDLPTIPVDKALTQKTGGATTPNSQTSFLIDTDELARAGVQFGHRHSKRHPKMAQFISGSSDTVDLIDLKATKDFLETALDFLKDVAKRKGVILFVGTAPHARAAVEHAAQTCGMPYVNERWVGGTFTNFQTVEKRLQSLEQLEKERQTGGFEKYIKREQLELQKNIDRLLKDLAGIRSLKRLPDAVIVVTPKQDILAIRESVKKNVSTVAIIDTNVDPALATYPIPANDDALRSVQYLLSKFVEAINAGKASTPNTTNMDTKIH